MDKEKTGKMIRQARIDKGYTQSELGELVVVLILLTGRGITDHRKNLPEFDRFGKWIVAISIITGVYMIAGMFINTAMVSRGQMPFHMSEASVGWYMEGRLIVIFVINLAILIADCVRRIRCAVPLVHMGTYLAVANVYLACVYSDALHRLDQLDFLMSRLVVGTLVVSCLVGISCLIFAKTYNSLKKGQNA